MDLKRKCICRHFGNILFTGCTGGCYKYQINSFHKICINPCCVGFIFRNIEIYLHFLSFLKTEMEQVVAILPLGQQPPINTLRPKQNGRLFADNTFKRIFLNENNRISIKISLKFVPKGLISNTPALVLIMAWRLPGDKPLSEPMMVSSLTHICVARPQWVNPA